jgi:hypothetical protein
LSDFFPLIFPAEKSLEVPTVGEAPAEDGPVQLRAAALDAYKVRILYPFFMPDLMLKRTDFQ